MINKRLSEIFEEMADVMEILGADRFRINAYRKAARVIHDCGQDVGLLAVEGKVQELPGIGKSYAEKINEFVNLGSLQAHRDLLKKVPPGLLDLLKVPGLGPKGVAAVWKGLKVAGLSDLQAAIDDGRLEGLAGFGAKKSRSLARGIAFVKTARGRVVLGKAMLLAEGVVEQLGEAVKLEEVEVAGSVRRYCETVGDIDILAQADEGRGVCEAFVQLPGVQEVLAAVGTKASIIFATPQVSAQAIQVDLRVIAPKSMGAALQYFTGSKAHNVRLREIARKKKLKLNEYGLFKGERQIAGESEEQIYEKLGLAYVPATLREDRGEVERAQQKKLPQLVELGDIRGDLHVHSPASDGRTPIEELVDQARRCGYQYLAISDHSGSSVIANGLDAKRLLSQIKKIKTLDKSLKGFTLLAASEVDILADGSLDYADEVLGQLDFVVASVHSGLGGTREKVTKRVLRAMENPYVNCIGHPTGRMINVREAMDLDMKSVIAQAVGTGTALEVNASPLRLDLKDIHCRMAVEAGARLIINTDAHDAEGLNQMRFGVATAQRGWVEKSKVLNCQPISSIGDWVAKKRAAYS